MDAYDFNLNPNSPNIDAAVSTSAPETDFMSNARFDAATADTRIGTYTYYDIGALKFTRSMPIDHDLDNDVDGQDIAEFITQFAAGTNTITLEEFAAGFGK